MTRRSVAQPRGSSREAPLASLRTAIGTALVAALAAAAPSTPSASQSPPSSDLGVEDRWSWRWIDGDSGLPDRRVREIEEASDGTLWVATDKGLAWYDGFTFHPALGAPRVAPTALAALEGGELAAAFPGGVWRGDRAGWARIALEDEVFPSVTAGPIRLSKIRVTDRGRLVIEARHADGQLRAHVAWRDGWRELEPDRALVSRPTHFTDPHRGHMPLLTLEGGLFAIGEEPADDAVWPIPADWLVTAAFPDPAGLGALVAVALPWGDRGIWEVGPSGRVRVNGTEEKTVLTLDTTPRGEAFLILVGGSYVTRDVSGAWHGPFATPVELEDVTVARFLRSGDLVVGGSSGLAWLQRSRSAWSSLGSADAAPERRLVLSLMTARSGDLWVGTAAGLERHGTDGKVTPIEELCGQPIRDVTALVEDDAGRIWIGSGSGSFEGVIVLDGDVATHLTDPALRVHVHRLVRDEQGRIWVAGLPTDERSGGLLVHEDGRFRAIDLPDDPLLPLRVYEVASSAADRLYVGTNIGLFRIEGGRWEELLGNDLYRGLRVAAVCPDGAGGAWFAHGASSPGLGRAHADGRVEYVVPADGSREPRALDLVRDDQGRLWVGGEDGLRVHDHGGLYRIEGRPLVAQTLAVRGCCLLVGTRGAGVVQLDTHAAASFGTRVDVALDVAEKSTLVARWAPHAFWSERPSALILTRYRLDEGEWSEWSLQRDARIEGLTYGDHRFEIEALGTPLRAVPHRLVRTVSVPPPLWARKAVALPLATAAIVVLSLAAWSTARWIGAARAHRDATARFEQLANNVRDVFWLVDWRTGEMLYVNPAHASLVGVDGGVPSRSSDVWRDLVHPDDREGVVRGFRESLEERGEWTAEFRLLRPDGTVLWLHVRAFPIRGADGAIERVAGIAEEITERRDAEVRQQRLSLELDHRVKNVLAQVAAIAEQTVARSTDLEEFSQAFIGRVRSMARTHEALASNRWAGVPLREVVETALGPTVHAHRCALIGPRIVLTPRASTSLGLALHELGTNAAKYGALRDARGSIQVEWRDEPGGVVALTWHERGSITTDAPRGQGLGLSLVRGLVEHDLGGRVDIRFEPHGLTVELRVPGVVGPDDGHAAARAGRGFGGNGARHAFAPPRGSRSA